MKKPRKKKSLTSTKVIVQNLINTDKNVVTTDTQNNSEMEAMRIKNHTKIFASMCPDEILDYYDNFETRSYYTALLLGDISGFTEMAEKYTKFSKGGPSKITEILNIYIGAMVQEILSQNGDLLKFSGDAFIVMWKLEDGRVMRDIATKAIKTACIIQKYFGTYEISEFDIILKVKLAISSGKTYFTSIGNPAKTSYYIITGKPVWEAKMAESLCRGGEIVVSSSCWQWVNLNEYIYDTLPDGIHILISSATILWNNEQDEYSVSNYTVSSSSSNSESSSVNTEESLNSNKSNKTSVLNRSSNGSAKGSENTKDYTLRPKVIKAAEAKLKKELRSYMLRPVIRSVDLDEPLEYLTEIRRVVILFVNVVSEETNRRTLIKLVNSSYLFVCSVVGEMHGCVNKTSLFDKDLIFLCVFGLRGDKHEIESQIGLRCASKLRRGLVQFPNVKSVSVGVTTGMTYCGVVGHVLRREYTVIGMSVNKAARLMCAYVDKVVCDRESFLLSHLEAKHFVLQEPKYLKGITNVGPIYEFVEQIVYADNVINVNKYPLLGRNKEIKIFYDMLRQILDDSDFEDPVNKTKYNTNILIIRGEPRIGKTRLLEEMTLLVPKEIPINFISLAPYDYKIPYILLRLIFYVPLEIFENSSQSEKRKKLATLLNESDKQYLWLLNDIFNINCEMKKKFMNFNSKQKTKLTKKLLTRLSRSCFQNLWIIFIDDTEFADEESLSLLPKIAKNGNVFLVLGIGNKFLNNYLIPSSILKHAEKTVLEGLNKMYHAAIVCQILDVVAIPAELEKVLQERSSGNAGWIESFLTNLLQAQYIVIESMTSLKIHNVGLVTPAQKFLIRNSNELNTEPVCSSNLLHSCWEMFETSFKEEPDENEVNKIIDDKVKHNVLLFTPNFILEDIDTEDTTDSILLNLFDSLTPLDQLLLKCASVLGEIIDRTMLQKLMQGVSDRDIGLSIYKLFQLRIIGCAVGDFSRSPGPAVMFKPTAISKSDIPIRCGCKRIKVTDALADLPYYASCGSMRFKLDMFRETTYRLLTDNQKVEFHSLALRHLQQNTFRCASCGGGTFHKLLGKQSIKETSRKGFNSILNEFQWSIDTDVYYPDYEFSSEKIYEPSAMSKCLQMYKPIHKSPTRTFSDMDFTNCECNLNLLTAYTHILEHCRGIGVSELLLVAILEFVEVCLSTLNIPQAIKLLNEGDTLIDTIYNPHNSDLIVLPYLKGKIQTLRGRCFLENGLIKEAMQCFEETLRIMKYKFPLNPISIKLKSYYLLLQQKLMFSCLRNFKVEILNTESANYNDQFANCLAQMFTVFKLQDKHDHARLAAIWCLNVALESSKDFFILCTAYGNMMMIADTYQYKSIIPYLERDAINLCSERKNTVEFNEINAIAELYIRIFFSRWLRGLNDSAIKIGLIAIRMARSIRSMNLKLIVLPRLIQILLMNCKYDIVVTMLQELELDAQNDRDHSGQTWYYSLNIDLLLEVGVSLISLEECEQFFQKDSSKIMNLKDTEASKRLHTCIWLWYIRIRSWGNATVWKNRQIDESIPFEYTMSTALTILKKLEGLIICYVYKINNKNYERANALLVEIKDIFKIMDNIQKIVISIHPRYFLMKAYYLMVKFHKKRGMRLLKKSKKIAEKIGDLYIYKWADHCEKSWTDSLSLIQQDFWKDVCTSIKQLDWHECSMNNWKFLPYSLPLPKDSTYV